MLQGKTDAYINVIGGTATAKNKTAIDCLYSAPAVEELSADPLYATVFVVRLFELYVESLSCTTDSKRRDQILEWFGSGSILRGRWFSSAENWLVSKNLDWRVTHSKAAEDVAKKWFDTGTKCRHTGIFSTTINFSRKGAWRKVCSIA